MLDRVTGFLHRAIHRPMQTIEEPWIMAQRWEHLLFVHWRVDAEMLRPHVPPGLEIEIFDGSAWLSLVPMRMADVTFRGMPVHIGPDNFPEMNLRTYVNRGDRPGIFFFSLDTDSDVNIWVARNVFHLPYFKAELTMEDGTFPITFSSRRLEPAMPHAEVRVRYQPAGPGYRPEPDSLDSFLGERYAMYATGPDGALVRGDIDHEDWILQHAEAEFEINTMPQAAGIPLLDAPPVLRYAEAIDVTAWRVRFAGAADGAMP